MNSLTVKVKQLYNGKPVKLLGETGLNVSIKYTYLLSQEEYDAMPCSPIVVATAYVNDQTIFILYKGKAGCGYSIVANNKVCKENIEGKYEVMLIEFVNAIVCYAINSREIIWETAY